MSIVIDDSRTLATDPAPVAPTPDLVAARAAGRAAGERLTQTALTPRQRAIVASVIGGAR